MGSVDGKGRGFSPMDRGGGYEADAATLWLMPLRSCKREGEEEGGGEDMGTAGDRRWDKQGPQGRRERVWTGARVPPPFPPKKTPAAHACFVP
jgi:hypothetical protein